MKGTNSSTSCDRKPHQRKAVFETLSMQCSSVEQRQSKQAGYTCVLSLGLLDADVSVGMCPRCSLPSSTPCDPGAGAVQGWGDIGTHQHIPALGTAVLRAHTDQGLAELDSSQAGFLLNIT